jgi:hypothetical protein
MKTCKKCGMKFEPTKGLVSYCSLKCRNSRTFSEEAKLKKSNANKGNIKCINGGKKSAINRWKDNHLNTLITYKNCTYCNKLFVDVRYKCITTNKIPSTTCSCECYIKIKKRNYSGNKHMYNGIEMDSYWEVEIAILLDTLNIMWKRPDPIEWLDSTNKKRRYFPDFYIPKYNIYLDPKNPILIEKQKEKLGIVSKQINLIFGHVDMIKTEINRLHSSIE